jgi:hypothetical protein
MGKNKTIANQLKTALHQQYKDGRNFSRHDAKVAAEKNGQSKVFYNKITSQRSLGTHLSRVEQFGKYIKEKHPDVRKVEQITPDHVSGYVQSRSAAGFAEKTVKADITAINHALVGSGHWEKHFRRNDYGIKPQRQEPRYNNGTGNRYAERQAQFQAKHANMTEYARAFGLRRSELMNGSGHSKTTHTIAGTKSLYEHRGTIYHVTTGKGGKLRVVECLKEKESFVRENYGQYVQTMPDYLQPGINGKLDKTAATQFREDHRDSERFFQNFSREMNIHREMRQYYATYKLEEIQKEQRFSRDEERTVSVGDAYLSQREADFVTHNLGHGVNRLDVISSYIGR